MKKALANAYSPFFHKKIDPDAEVVITTGANEGMLSAFMAFIDQGDEVILFEPYFDQYLSNIAMPGGTIKYVPLHPPPKGATEICSAAEWSFNIEDLKRVITPRTKMIVR